MLRALVIDDEESAINALKLLIEKYADDVKVVAECTDARKGAEEIDNFRPEIVFLDIQMPHMDGFELLKKLEFRRFDLIFVTAHEQYALQAFKERALDYLLKPVDPKDLQNAIKRVKDKRDNKFNFAEALELLEELQKENTSIAKIAIPVKGGVEYVQAADIVRLEADSNYSNIFLSNGKKHQVRKTLKEFEAQLCQDQGTFMRIHESHIVNLKCVLRYVKEEPSYIVTKDNANIPLSRNKKAEFLEWLKM